MSNGIQDIGLGDGEGAYRKLLAKLPAGAAYRCEVPIGQPQGRMACQTINHAAHAVLGVGWYSLKSEPGFVTVRRLTEQRPPRRPRQQQGGGHAR